MKVGIIGLGYVGLPLAVAFAEAGCEVVGVDVDARAGRAARAGRVGRRGRRLRAPRAVAERFTATDEHAALRECEAIVICVPTPLANQREPDLGYLVDAGPSARGDPARRASSWCSSRRPIPGTTRERLLPILEESGLAAGREFNLAFSPERDRPRPHRPHDPDHAEDRRRR